MLWPLSNPMDAPGEAALLPCSLMGSIWCMLVVSTGKPCLQIALPWFNPWSHALNLTTQLRNRSESPMLSSLPENCLVFCQARARQKVSPGEAVMPAPKCTLLDGILLGKDVEQPLGQEILEEGTCLLHTHGQWLNLFPQLPQVTSKGGDLAAICHQYFMAKAAR